MGNQCVCLISRTTRSDGRGIELRVTRVNDSVPNAGDSRSWLLMSGCSRQDFVAAFAATPVTSSEAITERTAHEGNLPEHSVAYEPSIFLQYVAELLHLPSEGTCSAEDVTMDLVVDPSVQLGPILRGCSTSPSSSECERLCVHDGPKTYEKHAAVSLLLTWLGASLYLTMHWTLPRCPTMVNVLQRVRCTSLVLDSNDLHDDELRWIAQDIVDRCERGGSESNDKAALKYALKTFGEPPTSSTVCDITQVESGVALRYMSNAVLGPELSVLSLNNNKLSAIGLSKCLRTLLQTKMNIHPTSAEATHKQHAMLTCAKLRRVELRGGHIDSSGASYRCVEEMIRRIEDLCGVGHAPEMLLPPKLQQNTLSSSLLHLSCPPGQAVEVQQQPPCLNCREARDACDDVAAAADEEDEDDDPTISGWEVSNSMPLKLAEAHQLLEQEQSLPPSAVFKSATAAFACDGVTVSIDIGSPVRAPSPKQTRTTTSFLPASAALPAAAVVVAPTTVVQQVRSSPLPRVGVLSLLPAVSNDRLIENPISSVCPPPPQLPKATHAVSGAGVVKSKEEVDSTGDVPLTREVAASLEAIRLQSQRYLVAVDEASSRCAVFCGHWSSGFCRQVEELRAEVAGADSGTLRDGAASSKSHRIVEEHTAAVIAMCIFLRDVATAIAEVSHSVGLWLSTEIGDLTNGNGRADGNPCASSSLLERCALHLSDVMDSNECVSLVEATLDEVKTAPEPSNRNQNSTPTVCAAFVQDVLSLLPVWSVSASTTKRPVSSATLWTGFRRGVVRHVLNEGQLSNETDKDDSTTLLSISAQTRQHRAERQHRGLVAGSGALHVHPLESAALITLELIREFNDTILRMEAAVSRWNENWMQRWCSLLRRWLVECEIGRRQTTRAKNRRVANQRAIVAGDKPPQDKPAGATTSGLAMMDSETVRTVPVPTKRHQENSLAATMFDAPCQEATGSPLHHDQSVRKKKSCVTPSRYDHVQPRVYLHNSDWVAEGCRESPSAQKNACNHSRGGGGGDVSSTVTVASSPLAPRGTNASNLKKLAVLEKKLAEFTESASRSRGHSPAGLRREKKQQLPSDAHTTVLLKQRDSGHHAADASQSTKMQQQNQHRTYGATAHADPWYDVPQTLPGGTEQEDEAVLGPRQCQPPLPQTSGYHSANPTNAGPSHHPATAGKRSTNSSEISFVPCVQQPSSSLMSSKGAPQFSNPHDRQENRAPRHGDGDGCDRSTSCSSLASYFHSASRSGSTAGVTTHEEIPGKAQAAAQLAQQFLFQPNGGAVITDRVVQNILNHSSSGSTRHTGCSAATTYKMPNTAPSSSRSASTVTTAAPTVLAVEPSPLLIAPNSSSTSGLDYFKASRRTTVSSSSHRSVSHESSEIFTV